MKQSSFFFSNFKKVSLNEYLKKKDPFFDKRQEYKYVLNIKDLSKVLDFLSEDFFLVGEEINDYFTRYFDTGNYFFFNQHRKGMYNRVKIRLRSYSGRSKTFLELKEKRKGVLVSKKRTSWEEGDSLKVKFLENRLKDFNLQTDDLKNNLDVTYQRIFLAAKDFSRRITIDLNIDYYNKDGKGSLLKDYCVIEVKQLGYPNDLRRFFLDNFGVRQSPFSKYCLSLCKLYNGMRGNKWKQIIKKYCNET